VEIYTFQVLLHNQSVLAPQTLHTSDFCLLD